MNLRTFLKRLTSDDLLQIVSAECDPQYEIAQILATLDGRPVLFRRVRGKSQPIVGNLLASRALLGRALDVPEDQVLKRLAQALRAPANPPVTANAPCQEVVVDHVDLGELPILTHLVQDGGPYITSSVCIVVHPRYGPNAAIHRLMVLGRNRVAARLVENRHTDSAWKAAGGTLPVAVCVGAPPHVQVAAAMSPAQGVDEMSLAQALADTPMTPCKTIPLYVPAETEIVLEGHFTGEVEREGPFIDLTGTLDIIRQQPVIVIDAITMREDAIYHALLPALGEHKALMGIPREANVFNAVSDVCNCVDVRFTPGGCSWLHAVVQIRKQRGDDPRRAIEATLEAHQSVKHVVVVDEDIPADDPGAVEWAVATRFQAARDLCVYENLPSSSLDPSAEHRPGTKTRTGKLGLDATVKGASRAAFTRLHYPEPAPARLREVLGL